MITVKLRTFGFLAVVLVGLFFSSCAVTPRRAAISGAAELGATQDIIPPDKCGRPLHRPMRPTFITIHSTDNTSRSANALNHALAMNKGLRGSHNRTGFLTWHFTVDDHSIYQTLPTNETGEHADYEGPGNRSSIGIEMCVNRGNNLDITIDRTAQLTARLMRQYNIPLDHVVPHMHWRMIRYMTVAIWGSNNAREFCSMAVVLVQNGVHSSPKSHFMHDEVGNDVSSGP